jgi:N-methylhydantoinase A/oxoprolinase/acetone carboxylase beta subunit
VRIGIDVGGTNTDGVLMDGRSVLAEVKTATTPDVTSGIVTALDAVLSSGRAEAAAVEAVMIGTTHFTNAVVEARRLAPVATVRLGLPATEALPPMTDWPRRLRDAIGVDIHLVHGGHEFDGSLISELDRAELCAAAAKIGKSGIRSVAISAVFSPVNGELEQEAAAILEEELGEIAVSLSHEIGRVGLLERENATIINASLRALGAQIVDAFFTALLTSGIEAPVYLSQNDGTLMTVEHAERYPVSTFASGPTNSMRGAALLSGLENCAVVDIGGTTADIGVLSGGFPREASTLVNIAGVRTNFRMPDVLPIGLGGGSLVRSNGSLTIGPDSVGYELPSMARIFGGDVLTASDVAVAGGRADFGDSGAVADLDAALVAEALEMIDEAVAGALDRMKTSADPIPLVVVGGGSVLLGESLSGATELIRPDHFGVANAIGAAIAQVGGEVDAVYSFAEKGRETVLDEAKQEAADRAVAAGARADGVRIVDVEEIGLAYLPGHAVRLKVKAVGDLELGSGDAEAGN